MNLNWGGAPLPQDEPELGLARPSRPVCFLRSALGATETKAQRHAPQRLVWTGESSTKRKQQGSDCTTLLICVPWSPTDPATMYVRDLPIAPLGPGPQPPLPARRVGKASQVQTDAVLLVKHQTPRDRQGLPHAQGKVLTHRHCRNNSSRLLRCFEL